MSITRRFFSLTQYYTQMNPNMISGSCDVIVTKSKDGILKCTPFYVRFGKKDIFKLRDHHRVTLFVNGNCITMAIKINKVGNIVFEKDDEEEEDVEEIYEIIEEQRDDIMNKYNIDVTRMIWLKKNKTQSDSEYSKRDMKLEKEQSRNNEIENAIRKLEKLQSCSKETDNSHDKGVCLNTDAEVIENVLLLSTNDTEKKSAEVINGKKLLKSRSDLKSTKQNMFNKKGFEFFDLIFNKKAMKMILECKIDKCAKFNLVSKRCFEPVTYYNFRERNKAFRRFCLIKPPTVYEALAIKQKNFKNIINSSEHLDFLINSQKDVSHLLLGVIFPQKNTKKCILGSQEGCCEAQVTFSQCPKQKIYKGEYRRVFEEFRVRSLENVHNLIVCLEGCSKCKLEFYMFYDCFVDLFFYLRNLIVLNCKSRRTKFESYVEKKLNEKRGYSFFKKVDKKPEKQMSLQMCDSQLKRLGLLEGRNELVFKVDGTKQSISIDCYLWNDTDKIIVSDIDGTITKSDAWGHLYALVGKDWTHYGVAELFTRIERNKYRFIYLSSRPIEQIAITRKYLHGIWQDGYQLPRGPILLSPNGIFGSIYTELILRRPEEFKIACLKNVKSLFDENPFFSGFGNRKTDIITYKTVGVSTNKIYTVDEKGRVLLEYSRSKTGSFMSLNAIVDNVFPAFSNAIYFEPNHWW